MRDNPMDETSYVGEPLPIEFLHLSKRTVGPLKRSGIDTVAELIDAQNSVFRTVSGLGPHAIQSLHNTIQLLDKCMTTNGDIDWFKYWNALGVDIVKFDENDNENIKDVVNQLPDLIEKILRLETDEKKWTIIERRYQLRGASLLTLEELGLAYGLTRERIRQIEAKALTDLRNVLLKNNYCGKPYHLHPTLTKTINEFIAFLKTITRDSLLETDLLFAIEQAYEIDTEQRYNSLSLLFELSGLQLIQFGKRDLDALWGSFSKAEQNEMVRIVERIDSLLTDNEIGALAEIDILINVNKNLRSNHRIDLNTLRRYLSLCSSVEQTAPGYYQGKFEHLTTRGNQVERILIEMAEPTDLSIVAREINHRLAGMGKRMVNERNLGNIVSADERFVPIGRSGEWGLASWNLDTGTIVELMKQFLVSRNSPATPDEVYDYVRARRSVAQKSIEAYLTFHEDFAKVDRKRWGLADWAEVKNAQSWTPIQVGSFVENFFKKQHARKLPYRTIKQALLEATGLSERQVQGLLNTNPVIRTHREDSSNELIAIFQSDYQKIITESGAGYRRRKKTLRQQVAQYVRNTLEKMPGQQMSLADLVQQLVAEFKRNDKTFYHYISDLDFVEKYDIPETRTRMLKLRHQNNDSLFSQADDIKSTGLKQRIERALSFFNERDIDVALFLLSKEFEETLKNYLTHANSLGKFPNLPSNLRLNTMVDFVGKENIITDRAVLHFLRQKRNDRAHGAMPSVSELQIIYKNAHVTAGMYLDYIVYFETLRLSL